MLNASKLIVLGGLLEALMSTYALAQTGQSQTPMMGGQMTWPMMAVCALAIVVLLLAAAALIKYLVFR